MRRKKNNMTVPDSLVEVWEWKEKVYEETKTLNIHKSIEYINKDVDNSLKKLGYLLIDGVLVRDKDACVKV